MILHPEYDIELLLSYGLHNNLLDPADIPYARNCLLEILRLVKPEDIPLPPPPEDADEVLEKLTEYAMGQGLLCGNTQTSRELLIPRLMDALLPRPSQVQKEFQQIYQNESPKAAADWFYQFCQKSGYIQIKRIEQNIRWPYASSYGPLAITINLSKPEKDPAEIAKLKTLPDTGYPKCMLCLENVGFAGSLSYPARQNLRTIPLSLAGEQWHFQYSPYSYFNEHCIVFCNEHVPMDVNTRTFDRLLDFLDIFPHYFIGSNAGLPIVGGSILNHDHFQGGNSTLPMANASFRETLHPKFPGIDAGLLDWPLPVIRLRSSDRILLIEMCRKLLEIWQNYSDASAGILAYTGNIPHNAITPIARMRDGAYEIDIVLRNNRTSQEHPLGIFHPHARLHHIKQENIGLIEVMGLFILPGRLKEELESVRHILCGAPVPVCAQKTGHPLHKHLSWIEELLRQYGSHNTLDDAHEILQREVGAICLDVLRDVAVYKDDESGRASFMKFLADTGLFILRD